MISCASAQKCASARLAQHIATEQAYGNINISLSGASLSLYYSLVLICCTYCYLGNRLTSALSVCIIDMSLLLDSAEATSLGKLFHAAIIYY